MFQEFSPNERNAKRDKIAQRKSVTTIKQSIDRALLPDSPAQPSSQ